MKLSKHDLPTVKDALKTACRLAEETIKVCQTDYAPSPEYHIKLEKRKLRRYHYVLAKIKVYEQENP